METIQFSPVVAEKASSIIVENLRFFYAQALDLEEYCGSYSPDGLVERAKNAHFYVLQDAGELLAVGGFLNNEVTSLYVKKSEHGKGRGKTLLSFLENEIKQSGHDSVVLKSGSYAVQFYEKQGYSKTGKVYSGDEDIEMIKSL